MKVDKGKSVIFVRNAIAVLQKQLLIKYAERDIYLQPTASSYKDGSVQHLMESKELANIYNANRIKVISLAKKCSVEL